MYSLITVFTAREKLDARKRYLEKSFMPATATGHLQKISEDSGDRGLSKLLCRQRR